MGDYVVPVISWMSMSPEDITELILRGANELDDDETKELIEQLEATL